MLNENIKRQLNSLINETIMCNKYWLIVILNTFKEW